ncbi:hypothetical protein AB0876_19260 [Mycobacterium sp. NPDC049093]
MGEGTGARLDTVDIADSSGWGVECTHAIDRFTKDGHRIEVHYTDGDVLDSAVKHGDNGGLDSLDRHTEAKVEQLRSWLTGRPVSAGATVRYPEADFTTEPGGWTRREFVAAVTDSSDHAFLLQFLSRVDANAQLQSQGSHARLTFGKRPNGALFVYPFGRRFPPFKLLVKDGRLMVAGCWKGNWTVTGHSGFAEIAALLGQDETGPAKAVATAGLDPDELWGVGDRVSAAVNR